MNQAAFQHGHLTAPLTALTLTDPVGSILVTITVFRETFSDEPIRVVGLVLTAATVGGGVWLAVRLLDRSRRTPSTVTAVRRAERRAPASTQARQPPGRWTVRRGLTP
ncbi:hypothetical protein [Micromonospora sp. NBC_00617]|uniref:hypothetical protein n=1 Tax=Micromonospora sp. NBC_00617 TaxID=2903587 RepID=UPI0030E27DFB